MSRFIFLLFILTTNSAIGQTNGLVKLTKTTPAYGIAISNFADTSRIKPVATANAGPAIVIIPSKMVCRQQVSSFFIVPADMNTSGTLIDPPAVTAEEATLTPTRPATEAKTSFTVEGISAGAGSDVLELLLKTPGRIVNNPDMNSLVNIGAFISCLSQSLTR